MIPIYFYRFQKRENSTLRPYTAGTQYDCVLKEPCSVIAPEISLNLGKTQNPTNLNYAYIPDFNRYYFVRDWTYSAGLWIASLEVDALASWRGYIGESEQYVLRSSDEWDGEILDMLYPAKGGVSYESVSAGEDIFVHTFETGYYCVGVVNKDTSGIGAVSYYIFTNAEFKTFLGKLLSSTSWTNFTWGDISEEVFKAIFNPLQYITSCVWLPFRPTMGTILSSLDFGWWTVTGISCHKIATNQIWERDLSWIIPKHPKASSRGKYLNLAPFSRYAVDFRPWGYLPIDPAYLFNTNQLFGNVYVDVTNGVGILEIGVTSTPKKNVLQLHETLCGVPIQLAQISRDYFGTVQTAISSGTSIVENAVSKDVVGAISSVISGIGDTVKAAAPQLMSTGSNGSIADFRFTPSLHGQFFEQVPESLSNRGRPLCQERTINTLPGYLLIADADISIPATAEENARIKAYMEGGFFFE